MEWMTIMLQEGTRMLRLWEALRVKSSPKYAQNFIGTVGFPFFDKNKKMFHENNIPLLVCITLTPLEEQREQTQCNYCQHAAELEA